jgi:hypothetical protein
VKIKVTRTIGSAASKSVAHGSLVYIFGERHIEMKNDEYNFSSAQTATKNAHADQE